MIHRFYTDVGFRISFNTGFSISKSHDKALSSQDAINNWYMVFHN